MLNLYIYSVLILFFCILLLLIRSRGYKSDPNKDKIRPFECGFDPRGRRRLQFCIKFFLIGVLFLVFDVEVRLILPLPFCQIFIMLFLLLLFLGLAYEWFYGGLEWIYVNRCALGNYWGTFFGELTLHLDYDRIEFDIIPAAAHGLLKF